MDNAAEFSSQAFNDYCMVQGNEVQHSVPYVHTQNGLVESLIKRIKLISRPLLQGCNLPTSCWGHAILHAAVIVQLRPTTYHTTSPLQLYVEINQVSSICENLDVLYTHQFLYLSELLWALTGERRSM
jgi:hypothetical protein